VATFTIRQTWSRYEPRLTDSPLIDVMVMSYMEGIGEPYQPGADQRIHRRAVELFGHGSGCLVMVQVVGHGAGWGREGQPCAIRCNRLGPTDLLECLHPPDPSETGNHVNAETEAVLGESWQDHCRASR
jgi:hypothetical protein